MMNFNSTRNFLATLFVTASLGSAVGGDLTMGEEGNTRLGVIFPVRQSSDIFENYPFIGIYPPFWLPSVEDVARVEGELERYLGLSMDPRVINVHRMLLDYRRQYIGYSEGDRKFIWINAFCSKVWSQDDSWRKKVVIALDGGACYFQIRFNVERREFDRLEINGDS